MGGLRSQKRKLNLHRVRIAEQVTYERVKIARQVVIERVKKDVEFAKDVLAAVGNNLPPEIKKAAEENIATWAAKKLEASAIIDPLQFNSVPLDFEVIPEENKYVQMDGPKLEKA